MKETDLPRQVFAPLGRLLDFVITVLEGTVGPNRYGPDPKSRSAT